MSMTLSLRMSVAVAVVTMGFAGGVQAQTNDGRPAWSITFGLFAERHPARSMSAALFGAELPALGSASEEAIAPEPAPEAAAVSAVPLEASRWPAPFRVTLPAAPLSMQPRQRAASIAGPEFEGNFSSRRPPLLLPLYASFGVLQGLDIHSTLRGLSNGAMEANPIMRSASSRRSVFVTAKAATAALTVVLAEKLWRRHRTASIAMMIVLNGVYATVVANNYRVGRN